MNIGKPSKKKLLISLTLLFFIISGCARFDVNLGIDLNNTAFLSYYLEIDVSEFDERQQHNFRVALHELALHYQDELEFSVALDIDSNPLVMTAQIQITNSSFEEAFYSLETMLTDVNKSIFMEVDMGMVSYPGQIGYIIRTNLDIPRIVKSYDREDLPAPLQGRFDEAMHTGQGTITVSMPADETVYTSHMTDFHNGQAIMTVPLSFTEETEFDLSGVLNIPNVQTSSYIGRIIEQQLIEFFGNESESAIEQQSRFRSISRIVTMVAAGLIALTLIITLVVTIVKRTFR